ncbi:Rrf2 family transcriptional regulator [Paenibacillus sp. FSL H8-0079]|uniref:Rrf2 family transcriptional regulator n=1 Tax=Paenibacillus sp. FSL H8-0079 TaxID=2921375 RepID=UPI0030EC860E
MNSELSVALYVLVLLGTNKERLTSSQISECIQVHPARIRHILSKFKKSGYLETKEGSDGGYLLSQNPQEINLKDLYTMISSKPLHISKRSLNSKESFPAKVDNQLEFIFKACELKLLQQLQEITLADMIDSINNASG